MNIVKGKMNLLAKGDKVVLNGCPFDDQIASEAMRYAVLKGTVMLVTKVKRTTEYGTSGQWVQTDHINEWIDKAWFKKA